MEKEIAFDDTINITSDHTILGGNLVIPEDSHALIIFVDDHGRGQRDDRNLHIASVLQKEGFATLLVDLLTSDEVANQPHSLDINHLADRIMDIRKWADQNPQTEHLNVGIFGFNTGASAAIIAASRFDSKMNAIVSLGGRPDLALEALKKIDIPILLIATHKDNSNVIFNEKALSDIGKESRLEVLQDAEKGFHEPVILEKITSLTKEWFVRHI